MKWAGYYEGVLLALPHTLVAWSTLIAGFTLVVRQTGVPGSILVVALFVSLPILIQGILAPVFGSYRRVPVLGWIVIGMLEGMGLVFLLFLFVDCSSANRSYGLN